MSVKYWLSVSVISVKYQFTQIFTLVIFNRYLTDTNQYILETKLSIKYWFIPFSILVRFNQYLANTYQYIHKVILSVRSAKYWLNIGYHFLP